MEDGPIDAGSAGEKPRGRAPGSPERGELEGDWGRLLAAEKKPDEAVVHSRLAVKESPDDEDSYVRLAWLLRAERDVPAKEREKIVAEADQAINDLVANNPASAKAHLARWRYRREFDLLDLRGDDPKRIPVDKAAAEDVDAALSQAPEDVDALVAKADAEVLLRHPDQAYESLHHGLKLQETKGYHAASDMGEFELLWHLATLLLSDQKLSENADKMAELEQAIARIRKTRGQPAAADYLQARLLIQRKEWAKAAALLERTRPALAAQQAHADLIGQIDLCLGQCDLALEEPAQAEQSFRLALEWDPDRAEAHLGLGEALRVLGRVDEALDHFRKAAEGAQDAGKGWLEVARLEIMRQLQQDDGRRDWTKANEAIDRAAANIPPTSPDGADPALLRAEVLAAQGRWDDAEKLLRDARDAHPDQVEFWTALANFAGRRDPDQKRALKILDEADAALHDRVELRIARAIRLAAGPKPDLAALAAVVKKDRANLRGEELEKLLGGLAEAEAQAGQTDEAAKLLEELAKAPGRSNDLHLRLTLFDMAVRRHDADAMETSLKAIREVEGGEGAFYGLGQALRAIDLARSGKPGRAAALDDAWRALDRASALRPHWSAVELARADVDDLSDDPEGAIKHLEEAVRIEQGRVGPEVVQRLVEGLYGRGRYAEAAGYVAVLRQSLLVNSPLGRLAAGVALNTGDMDRAKGLIETAVRPESKNFRDLLLRAHVHEAMNQDKEAEADYRRATEEAPDEPTAWVAYIGFLGNHGRETRGAGAHQERRRRQGSEGQGRPDRGPVLRGVGHDEGGRRALRRGGQGRAGRPGRHAGGGRLQAPHRPHLRGEKAVGAAVQGRAEGVGRRRGLGAAGAGDGAGQQHQLQRLPRGAAAGGTGAGRRRPVAAAAGNRPRNERGPAPGQGAGAGDAAAAAVPRRGDPADGRPPAARRRRPVHPLRALRGGRQRGQGGGNPQGSVGHRRPADQAGVSVHVRPAADPAGQVRQGSAQRGGAAGRARGTPGDGAPGVEGRLRHGGAAGAAAGGARRGRQGGRSAADLRGSPGRPAGRRVAVGRFAGPAEAFRRGLRLMRKKGPV